MIPLGLSAADLRALQATLAGPHQARIHCYAQTLDGDNTSTLTSYLDSGQVDMDQFAAVSRSATVVLHDPKRSLPFDSDHPSDTALFLDRMIYLSYGVLVGDSWIQVPVFRGPVTKLDRNGAQVTVEAQGKDLLALAACWRPLMLAKGMKKTDAIKRILAERAGETRFDVPDHSVRLPKSISLTRESVPWHTAKAIAHSMGQQLMYDGAGTVRMRPLPTTNVFTFTGDQHVVGDPQISYSGDVINTVGVLGAIPKGSKTHISATAVAPANHPLSPQRLGRNGVPRYLLPDGKLITDDSVKTVHEAQTVAEKRLADGLLQSVDVSFDSIPIPFLDPGDLCHVATSDGSVTFRLTKFSLPLVTDGSPMTVGYNKRVSVRLAKRNKR